MLVSILEMTKSLSQSPRDRILWTLANNGGGMERSRLRAATGMRYALLNPLLKELAREGQDQSDCWNAGGFDVSGRLMVKYGQVDALNYLPLSGKR
jgi:hypothetical protein